MPNMTVNDPNRYEEEPRIDNFFAAFMNVVKNAAPALFSSSVLPGTTSVNQDRVISRSGLVELISRTLSVDQKSANDRRTPIQQQNVLTQIETARLRQALYGTPVNIVGALGADRSRLTSRSSQPALRLVAARALAAAPTPSNPVRSGIALTGHQPGLNAKQTFIRGPGRQANGASAIGPGRKTTPGRQRALNQFRVHQSGATGVSHSPKVSAAVR
jgi:hypothetical protein